jgi:uncharacterized protein YjbI with pentapeptide repeats
MAKERHTHTAEQEKEATKQPTWWKRLWDWTEFGKKSGWAWLQLFIVPLVLAVGGFWFTAQQEARQQALEERRAKVERELEEQRAQDAALQAYLDQMSNLLLESNLRESDPGSEVRTLARARTLTVLERLDPGRKTHLLQFLLEADLVGAVGSTPPVIRLSGADLNNTAMRSADLSDADLTNADLVSIKLNSAVLIGADLHGANLSNANLRYANLTNADLSNANLRHADLSGANLTGAGPDRVSGADLFGADLRYADLSDANLTAAVLIDAKLHYADLSGANLLGAIGVDTEELEQNAQSLQDAIMPDGTINPGGGATIPGGSKLPS